MAKIFYTPTGYSGSSELTAGNGLNILDQGKWRYSQQGYNDGATFGLSLTYPNPAGGSDFYYGPPDKTPPPQSGGELHLEAQNWPIAVIGNDLTAYTDPTYGVLPSTQCRIMVTGYWQVIRQQNSNSFCGFGVDYTAETFTDLGDQRMIPNLFTFVTHAATYIKQGSAVTGGAIDTFGNQKFSCRVTEVATSQNSNKEFQSNTITRPAWIYNYSKSWEIDI